MKTTADRLIEAFEKLNLTGYRVQKIYGLSGGAVSNWRRNLCQPRLDFVDRFCDDYKISKVWLLTGQGEMTGQDGIDTKQQIFSVIGKIKAATGATNKDLAVIMGAYPTVISDMKAGKTTARPEWLHKLSEEYGYILNDIDLKKEVWKLKGELEEIKKKLYI